MPRSSRRFATESIPMARTTATATTTVSQLSCFSSISRTRLLRPSSLPTRPSEVSLVLSVGGVSNLDYTTDQSKPNLNDNEQVSVEEEVGNEEGDPSKVYASAKIHDFCFGIPYGGIVFSGGLLGFIFSRNLTALGTGVPFRGALLALSTFN